MSLNRHNPRRDANEPAIRKRFEEHHGWHTEPRSSSGGWDLDCYQPPYGGWRIVIHVDVKTPTGKVTKPQEKKWKAMREKGIPVYVVRTEADVDALVGGTLGAWEPSTGKVRSLKAGGMKKAVHYVVPRPAYTKPAVGKSDPVYIPPRSRPVDAAKEAEETFAPPAGCVACGGSHKFSEPCR